VRQRDADYSALDLKAAYQGYTALNPPARSATMHTGTLVVLVLVLLGIIAGVLVWQLGTP